MFAVIGQYFSQVFLKPINAVYDYGRESYILALVLLGSLIVTGDVNIHRMTEEPHTTLLL